MFGMGMGEILLIAVVALLVVGPDRLPGAAKAIGKGIRDLRASTKDLQATIEQDTQIGEAVRELKGALRGDPESLYKRATGEDFNAPEKNADESPQPKSSGEPPVADQDDDHMEDSDGNLVPTPDKELDALLDKAYANSSDAWGQEARNPHEVDADEAPAPDIDPDLPVIKQPAGSVARGPESDEDTDESTDDSSHG